MSEAPRPQLVDLARASEDGEAIARLKRACGMAVKRDRFVQLLRQAYPGAARHPEFERNLDDVISVAAELLGLSFWGRDWLATPAGIRELERTAGIEPPESDRQPPVRATSGERRDAPASRTKRPDWWLRLREADGGLPTSLKRLTADDRSRLKWYLEPILERMSAQDELSVGDWAVPVLRSPAHRISDADRLKAHSWIVERRLHRIEREQRDPAEIPVEYEAALVDAYFLGIGDDVIDLRLRRRMAIVEPVRLETGHRIAPSGLDPASLEFGLMVDHARRFGTEVSLKVSSRCDLVVVARASHVSQSVATAVRRRIPMVTLDEFLATDPADSVEASRLPFAGRRVAACGRCGVIHAFDAGQTHRHDRLCDPCRLRRR